MRSATVLPPAALEAVERLTGSAVASVQECTPGYAYQLSALAHLEGEDPVFVKWVDPTCTAPVVAGASAALAREAANLARLGHSELWAPLRAFDPHEGVLLTAAIDGCAPNWEDPEAFARAAEVLGRFAELPTELAAGKTLLDWSCFAKSRPVTDATCEGRDELAECYANLAALPMVTLAHIDAHPWNWVEHGPRLRMVDMDHMGLAPRGWDVVYLACFLGALPAQARIATILERCTREAAIVMCGAVVFRFACDADADHPLRWPRLAAALLPDALELFDRLRG